MPKFSTSKEDIEEKGAMSLVKIYKRTCKRKLELSLSTRSSYSKIINDKSQVLLLLKKRDELLYIQNEYAHYRHRDTTVCK
ncbi:hypothetical protein RCL_jg1987.t1 [Rhizophagus clarus]|uniref:Uncharacterized protein n=1 Tax=Rhizophagus clarus TaxID=94130 RepID=A0A8H3M2H3_9GLOM|nr:hypothetical protein RCL_jg1987.t1 [Rhizophagus clarus]